MCWPVTHTAPVRSGCSSIAWTTGDRATTPYVPTCLYKDGLLILSINHEAQRAANLPRNSKQPEDDPKILKKDPPIRKSVAVLDAKTGKLLWKTGEFIGNSTKTAGLERITAVLQGINADVNRPESVKVSLPQLDGTVLEIETDGLLARALQHEIDARDG